MLNECNSWRPRNSKYHNDENQLILYQNLNTQIVDATEDADTIQGSGQISDLSQIINLGTILANQPTVLVIQPNVSTLDNLGTLEATAGDHRSASRGPSPTRARHGPTPAAPSMPAPTPRAPA